MAISCTYLYMKNIETLFISDVHLGSKNSNPEKLLSVLKKYEFKNLVIVGDFIDLTSLKRKFFWKESHSTVIQKILKLSRKGVKITYLIGNHDFYIRELIKEHDGMVNLGSISIMDEYIHTTRSGERIFICHGDQFDGVVSLHPFLYALGDKAYDFSIWLNKILNKIRNLFGLKYWSLSSYLKRQVKSAVSFVSDFKKVVLNKTSEKDVDAVMIGHIHTPAIEILGDKVYYNTGDFCETCSYLIETIEGKIELSYE